MTNYILYIITAALAMVSQGALGQMVEIRGTVYDRSQQFAMPGVSVLGTSGGGTMTDSIGHYSIRLRSTDSIYFSYLGKFTHRFAVRRLAPEAPLNMSLAISVDSLPLVVVRPKLYRYDSAENREEYRRVFEYQQDDLVGAGNGGVGLNLDALFGAKKNRQMLALQRRLIEEEHDKYVDHRFNRLLVKKITGIQQRPELDAFMRLYRPSYEFIQNCENDYEFYKYIRDCGVYFSKTWKEEHPE